MGYKVTFLESLDYSKDQQFEPGDSFTFGNVFLVERLKSKGIVRDYDPEIDDPKPAEPEQEADADSVLPGPDCD